MRLLDIKKIEQFEQDLRTLPATELHKKYPSMSSIRMLPGYTFEPSWEHWLHTLRAHAHNRIHAKQIGKKCEYGAPVKREKGSGQTYPLLSKIFVAEITTIEQQAEFIGKEFLKNFMYENDLVKAA
jgi:hypothetical protein